MGVPITSQARKGPMSKDTDCMRRRPGVIPQAGADDAGESPAVCYHRDPQKRKISNEVYIVKLVSKRMPTAKGLRDAFEAQHPGFEPG